MARVYLRIFSMMVCLADWAATRPNSAGASSNLILDPHALEGAVAGAVVLVGRDQVDDVGRHALWESPRHRGRDRHPRPGETGGLRQGRCPLRRVAAASRRRADRGRSAPRHPERREPVLCVLP